MELWSSLGTSNLQGSSSPSQWTSCLASDWDLSLTGGPAEKAGLQQLDTVLQLNERPVEHWKCVELAHEIRSVSLTINTQGQGGVVWGSPGQGRAVTVGLGKL